MFELTRGFMKEPFFNDLPIIEIPRLFPYGNKGLRGRVAQKYW
jgi:hypothetical protein